jgi:hypothetical protein
MPQSHAEMVVIYSAERSNEAEIIRSILDANGITPLYAPDFSAGLFGVLARLNIAVAAEDVYRAKEILQAYDIDPDDPAKKYIPSDILRTINNFFPKENKWVKVYAYFYFFTFPLGYFYTLWLSVFKNGS